MYMYNLDSAGLIFESITRVTIDARIPDCIYCMPHAGAAGFFTSAAVGRGKVNWTRRYSVYILPLELVFASRRFYAAPRRTKRTAHQGACARARQQKRNPGIPTNAYTLMIWMHPVCNAPSGISKEKSKEMRVNAL